MWPKMIDQHRAKVINKQTWTDMQGKREKLQETRITNNFKKDAEIIGLNKPI